MKSLKIFFYLIIRRNLIRFLTRILSKKLMPIMTHFEKRLKRLCDSIKNFMIRMSFKMMLKRRRSLKSLKIFEGS